MYEKWFIKSGTNDSHTFVVLRTQDEFSAHIFDENVELSSTCMRRMNCA